MSLALSLASFACLIVLIIGPVAPHARSFLGLPSITSLRLLNVASLPRAASVTLRLGFSALPRIASGTRTDIRIQAKSVSCKRKGATL